MRCTLRVIHTVKQTFFKEPTDLKRLGCFAAAFLLICFSSCSDQVGFQERLVSIPKQAWTHEYQPWIQIQVQDSTVPYRVYVVIRHNQQFKYDNLLLRYGYIAPGDSVKYQEVNLPLAKNGQWLGDTLGSIVETRIRLGGMAARLPIGNNGFVLSHLMPDEPLLGVLQLGIRIEAAGPYQTAESAQVADSTGLHNTGKNILDTDTTHKAAVNESEKNKNSGEKR